MKTSQRTAIWVFSLLIGENAFADAPNPFQGFSYHKGMTFIKLGEEKGREILQTPDNQQVCAGRFREYLRFGYVDGTNCMITSGGAQSINLNSDQAYLVHVPESGKWISANDMQNYGHEFYMLTTGPDKASSPAFIKGNPAGTFYAPSSHNGYWYANKEGGGFQERNNGNKSQIQVFMPNALPNPIFGTNYNPGMKLFRFGKEEKNPILTAPDGSKICAGLYRPQNAFRFGKVEGTNCLVSAWGAQNINLNSSDALLVSFPASGDWLDLSKAKNNSGGKLSASSAGIQDNLYPTFIPGKGVGVYSRKDDRSWYVFVQNGQYSEIDAVNEGSQSTAQVFIPKADIAKLYNVNPLFTLVKSGDEKGKEAQLLKDPIDNLVCAYDYDPSVFGAGERQFVIGNVKDGRCRFEAWGSRAPEMQGGYYVIANGDWKKRSEVSDADMLNKAMLVQKQPGLTNYSTGIGSVKGFAGKMHGDEQQYKVWYMNAIGKAIGGVPVTDREHMVFVGKEGAPEAKPFVPYPSRVFKLNDLMTLIRPGEEAGKDLAKDPKGNTICAFDRDPDNYGNGDRQFLFGNSKDGKCFFEYAGLQSIDMKNGGYYLTFKFGGQWKSRYDSSPREVDESSIVFSNALTNHTMGIASYQGFAGKREGDKIWNVTDYSRTSNVDISHQDSLLFILNKTPPVPAAAPTSPAVATASTSPVALTPTTDSATSVGVAVMPSAIPLPAYVPASAVAPN